VKKASTQQEDSEIEQFSEPGALRLFFIKICRDLGGPHATATGGTGITTTKRSSIDSGAFATVASIETCEAAGRD